MKKEVYEYISQKANDPIVEWKKCKWCGEEFAIFESEVKMLKKLSPKLNGKIVNLPLPDLCPNCRDRNRLMFRKETNLYRRKCDKCGKFFISIFSEDFEGKVYCHDCWYDDNHDPTLYGQEYDDSKSILEQLKTLKKETPILGIFQSNDLENSTYTQHAASLRNCYLSGGIVSAENTLYSFEVSRVKNVVDVIFGTDLEIVYFSNDITNSSKVIFGSFVKNSSYVFLGDNIENSNYVLLSSGVINQNYVYKNQKLSPQERKQKFEEIKKQMKSYKGLQNLLKEFDIIKKNSIKKNINIVGSENCIGNEIYNSRNMFLGFDCNNMEDSLYCKYSRDSSDIMDVYSAYKITTRSYNSAAIGAGANNCYFSYLPWLNADNIFYSFVIMNNCSNMFLCLGCRNGMSNCILNKKYTSSEWNLLAEKIVSKMQMEGIWGRFLDSSLSYYPYNDSLANDYYPINKLIINGQEKIINKNGHGVVNVLEPDKFWSKAILNLGGENINILWRTKDKEVNIPNTNNIVNSQDLPDNIDEVDENILEKIIVCKESGRLYKITKLELNFYKKLGIALPRIHPDLRYKKILEQRPPRELNLRKCDKCGKQILSVYDSNFEGKVYCEECYNKEIYG